MISVSIDGVDLSAVIWTYLTPWSPTAQYTHHAIAGSDVGGPTYMEGQDNAVATLSGRVPLTDPGTKGLLMEIIGKRATVTETAGTQSASWIADVIQASPDSSVQTAWMFFTLGLQLCADQEGA